MSLFRKFVLVMLILVVIIMTIAFIINIYVVVFANKNMLLSEKDFKEAENVDCIIVLGAAIWGNNPSPILQDRLDIAIELYKKGLAPKMLMSGDHSETYYNEVKIMKEYAIKNGVPSSDIFMDHAGFSTYDTMYRAKEVFNVKKAIIVTQKYHLFRAVYIANKLGIEGYGFNSDPQTYINSELREMREILARNKDFFACIFKVLPKYLGEKVDITQDGDVTNDEEMMDKTVKGSGNIK